MVIFFFLTLVLLWPLTKGLILLPLDLLISNYRPWYSPGTILLKNFYMQDSIVQLFPWKHFVFTSLTNGVIPFWNPYQHLGMPFMASMKPMVWYPLNILYLLGEIPAWHALLFLQLFLSMVFAYLLSRDFLKDRLSGILVAISFAFSSLMIGVLEFGSEGHVLLWLPLYIFCVKRYVEKQKSIYALILGTTVAAGILAGQLQYTAYILLAVAGFILWYGLFQKVPTKTYLVLLGSIVLGVGISAIQLVPSMELFAHSYRGIAHSSEIFTRGLLAPHQLFRLFAPDLFGHPMTRDLSIGYIETSGYFGIVPLFFCLYAMVFGRKHAMVRFLAVVFWVAVLLSLNGIGQILLVLRVPLLTSGEAGRIFSLTLFSGALLSGFGMVEFFRPHAGKRQWMSIGIFVVLFALAVGSQAIVAKSNALFLRNIRFSVGILGGFVLVMAVGLLVKRKVAGVKNIIVLAILGLTFFDLYRLGYRFLTFSNEKFLYPNTQVIQYIHDASSSTLARTYGQIEPELGTYLNVYSVDTYNPLYIERTGRLMQALQGKLQEPLPVNKYLVALKRKELKPAFDFLGVSLIITEKDADPSIEYFGSTDFQKDFRLVHKDDRYAVYQNTTAFPRFGLYYHIQEVSTDQTALQLLAADVYDLRQTLILEDPLPIRLEEGTGSAKLVRADANAQEFSVTTDKPALFYISDTYFPGWKATVNKDPTTIYRANYNFRAVVVPSGESSVSFTYVPSNFWIGVAISAVSLTLLLLFVFL